MTRNESYRLMYNIAQQLLEKMQAVAGLEQLREDYFIGLDAHPKSLGNVFGRFITSAQNSSYRSNAINFKRMKPISNSLSAIMTARILTLTAWQPWTKKRFCRSCGKAAMSPRP